MMRSISHNTNAHHNHRERLRATRQALAAERSASPLALILGLPEARSPRSISGKHHPVSRVECPLPHPHPRLPASVYPSTLLRLWFAYLFFHSCRKYIGYVAGRGRGMGDLARSQSEGGLPRDEGDRDKGDYSESNYDDFSGYGGAVRARVEPVNYGAFGQRHSSISSCIYSFLPFLLLPSIPLIYYSSSAETHLTKTTIERPTISTRLSTTGWTRGGSEGTYVCVCDALGGFV